MRDQVFIGYSHKDRKYLEKLEKHLKPFEDAYTIKYWDDRKIEVGDDWHTEIKKALASAKVAVLLVSPDYLASDYITQIEFPELLKARQEDLHIFWVHLRPCAYRRTPLAELQCAHDPEKPLESLESWRVDKFFVGLCELIEKKLSSSPATPQSVIQPGEDADGITTSPDTLPSLGAETDRLSTGNKRPLKRAVKPVAQVADFPPADTLREKLLEQPVKPIRPDSRNKRRVATLIAVVVAIGMVIVYTRLRHSNTPIEPPPIAPAAMPLTRTTPLSQRFDNLTRWDKPEGWMIDPRHWLVISGQKELGFLKEDFFGDLDMSFNLKLLNSGGAAWAIRVKDARNYYWFYLSGPTGTRPNTFVTYKVVDNIPKEEEALSVAQVGLEAGKQYLIEVNVTSSTFITKITPAAGPLQGQVVPINEYTDLKNTFPVGSIGFRAFSDEEFSIIDLHVWPPHTRTTP